MNSTDDGCLPAVVVIGYILGLALAVVISWSLNHSIGWGALHGLLSWVYVIYYAAQKL